MTEAVAVPQHNNTFTLAMPAQPAPQVFNVPPAGGNPVRLPNQTEGWVQQPSNQQVPAAPAANPAAQAPPAQQLDAAGITALINAALGTQQAAPAPVAAPVDGAPAWLPTNVNTFNPESITDPTIRSMATVLQAVGKDLDLTRVIGRALADGDVSLIDYAYLHEKGGANAQQLAEIAKGVVQAVSAKADAVTKEVHALVGGEANWVQSTAVFNQTAPHELKVTVSRMLDSTDEAFIKAGAKIVAEYAKQSGQVSQLGSALLQNNASAGQLGGGLSKVAFQAELQKIKPDSPTFEQDREVLFTRRALGKSAGL